MKQLALLSLVGVLTVVAAVSSTVYAQAKPEFKLGFKALADQIPNVVGEPLENERWGANGDSLQQTAKGLMVWRKADNWTAFTNGSRTWIYGPSGVQERANDARFDWEAPAPAATPVSPRPAPTQVTLATYAPEVRAMDQQSADHGVMLGAFMRDLDSEWVSTWEWRPSRPTTIYLFFDGNRLADTYASLRESPLSDSERTRIPTWVSTWSRDASTRGWAILLNLSQGHGTRAWEATIKSSLVHNYAMVWQSDTGRGNSPRWFRAAFADLLAFAKVPATTTDDTRPRLVARYRDAGRLPTIRYVHENYESMTAVGDTAQLANGIADLAVSFLVDQAGGRGLVEVEKRVAVGDNFEAALQAVTGYTLERLDAEYRVKIPR